MELRKFEDDSIFILYLRMALGLIRTNVQETNIRCEYKQQILTYALRGLVDTL